MFSQWLQRLRSARRAAAAFAVCVFVLQFSVQLTPPSLPAASAASDGPGNLSHFDLARQDCVGTARNTSSKVWFTIANGVLSDVYFPTVDNTNVETLQYIVTDGSSFTDLQSRDTSYSVRTLSSNSEALDCDVTT